MSRQVPVGSATELATGQRKLAVVDGRSIVLFNVAGTIHAVDNSCPHNGASLASGQLDGPILQCPAHGLRFDLRTGCMPSATGGMCLKTFPVVTDDDGRLLLQVEEPTTAAA
jgi:3-phenylpropionate/trans-cinnamate dioxygenase ferredoxin subunit